LTGRVASAVLGPRAGINWVTDAQAVIVVTCGGDRLRVLRGIEATVWSWMTLSAPRYRLAELLACLSGVELPAAAERVREFLDMWCEAGLLEPILEGEAGRG